MQLDRFVPTREIRPLETWTDQFGNVSNKIWFALPYVRREDAQGSDIVLAQARDLQREIGERFHVGYMSASNDGQFDAAGEWRVFDAPDRRLNMDFSTVGVGGDDAVRAATDEFVRRFDALIGAQAAVGAALIAR